MSAELKHLREVLTAIVQTNGVANCYDRYCRDDEWTYCIFCEEGDHNPDAKLGWKHAPDCMVLKARVLLAIGAGLLPVGYEVVKWPQSYRITYQDKYLIVEGAHVGFDTEFEARLFCWQQAKERNE